MEVKYKKGQHCPIVITFGNFANRCSHAITIEDAAKLVGLLEDAIMTDAATKNGCCLECGHGDVFELLGGEKKLRCWSEPGVCDHAFCISINEAERYTCENFITKENFEKQIKAEKMREIGRLEEQLKSLKKEI